MNPVQALITMAKGGDLSMAIFVMCGGILLDKGETIPALICFFFALISTMFSLWCKSAYHLEEKNPISSNEPE